MAEQKDDIELVEPKKKSRLMLIVIAAVVLLLVAVGAGYFLLSGDSDAETTPVRGPAIYHSIDSPFIVNFADQSDSAVRYLQIRMKVMTRDQKVIDAFVHHEPALQHELLLLFYSQNYDDLNTTQGTQALQQSSLELINEFLRTESGIQDGVEAVLFTSLIMQ
ncbi:flagellar biosynthesis protein FliL [Methylophaga lonarensis MPL]|uniref:Flagellar protein FliL n=1 Tax=Methylophaga lonarensis MPL TaxID=1286106 RepID=M7NXQ2_9GAMM|nr:flagellar basal body-associated FliL family protein [Methylophaga lonarensis]EMR11971.1 flagellar biosynthesis protein FliL [Methylophaga lonarensis MPL]